MKSILWAFLPVALFIQLSALQTSADPLVTQEVIPGHYKVEGQKPDQIHELYIRKAGDGLKPTYYGFFKWGTGYLTSMFEITVNSSNGEMTFFPVVQTKDFKFETDFNTPIYNVSQDLRSNERSLKLEWTNNATNFGSTIHCSLKPTFKLVKDGQVWGDFNTLPASTVLSMAGKRNREKNLEKDPGQQKSPSRNLFLNITRSATDPNDYFIKSENFWFETKNWESFYNKNVDKQQKAMAHKAAEKAFGSIETIPGVLLAREKTGDSIVGIGGDIATEVAYLLVPISDQKGRVKKIHTVYMAPGVTECGYMSIGVSAK